MSIAEAERKAARIEQLTRDIQSMSDNAGDALQDTLAFWIPGRIEVLGKHTDYGGGRSLLCAVERGICVVARPRSVSPQQIWSGGPSLVRVVDANSGESIEFDLSLNVATVLGHWSNYPITVARRIAANFTGPMLGADIVFASDLPHAAGVSSSSALVVAVFLALSAVNGLPQRPEYRDNIRTPEDLAGYLGCVENGLAFKSLRGLVGVGTFGGSEDQTAILCSRPNSLVQYSFCPIKFERTIVMPLGYTFVLASSGILAEKTGAALDLYNRVSSRLTAGLERWREATGRSDNSMGAAIASSPDAPEQIRAVLSGTVGPEYSAESLIQRFDQFHFETNEIIPAAGDALARGDLRTFGELVSLSQLAAERSLGNQIPETIALASQARQFGAVAASAFGAGFGGSVWALVESASAETFRRTWSDAYAEAFPERAARADFFSSVAGPPAVTL